MVLQASDVQTRAITEAHSTAGAAARTSCTASAEFTPADCFSVGVSVEVRQWEDGFDGAWFAARIVAIEPDRARVRYADLLEVDAGAGQQLEAWAPLHCLRPMPPPSTTADFVASLRPGSFAEAYLHGGHWPCRVQAVGGDSRLETGILHSASTQACSSAAARDDARLVIQLLPTATERSVPASLLRPSWIWTVSGGWSREGHACAAGAPVSAAISDQPVQEPARASEASACQSCGKDAPCDSSPTNCGSTATDTIDSAVNGGGSGSALPPDHEASAAAPSSSDVTSQVPAWAQLGCEVEWQDDVQAELRGAWFPGEVVDIVVDKGELDANGDSASTHSSACKRRGVSVCVQSRTKCERSPYAPNGFLIELRTLALEQLRPRPPPPPAGFLEAAPTDLPLQRRVHGGWWPVALLQVTVERSSGGTEKFCYHVRSPDFDEISGTVDASVLRPPWKWNGSACAWQEEAAAVAQQRTTSGSSELTSSRIWPSLKGRAASEAAGERVRVWVQQVERRFVPAIGVVLGYVQGRGVSVAFGPSASSSTTSSSAHAPPRSRTAAVWLTDANAWEWLPGDELERPTGPDGAASGADTAASPAADVTLAVSQPSFCAPRPPPSQRETAAVLHGKRIRVWTDDGISCVGYVLQSHAEHGLLTRLPQGCAWINGKHDWRWLPTDERVGLDELMLPECRHLQPPRSTGCPARLKKSPSAAVAGGEARAPHLRWRAQRALLEEGAAVELWGREEGFIGSWYQAEVLKVVGKQAYVAIEELFEEGTVGEDMNQRLKEWWPIRRIRPLPPDTPEGFASRIRPGEMVNLRYEGGWWDVKVTDITLASAPEEVDAFSVLYEEMNMSHTVEADRLRPCWFWAGGAWRIWQEWKQPGSEPPEHGHHAWAVHALVEPPAKPPRQTEPAVSGMEPTGSGSDGDTAGRANEKRATGTCAEPKAMSADIGERGDIDVQAHASKGDANEHPHLFKAPPSVLPPPAPAAAPVSASALKPTLADGFEGGSGASMHCPTGPNGEAPGSLGAATSATGMDVGPRCALPAALFEPRYAPPFAFPSRQAAERFVASWCAIVFDSKRTDRSTQEILWYVPNGALVSVKCSDLPEAKALGAEVGTHVPLRLISLDMANGLLLYPDSPSGTLYTPTRICKYLNTGHRWKKVLRVFDHSDAGPPLKASDVLSDPDVYSRSTSWFSLSERMEPCTLRGHRIQLTRRLADGRLVSEAGAIQSQDSRGTRFQVLHDNKREGWYDLSFCLSAGLASFLPPLPPADVLEAIKLPSATDSSRRLRPRSSDAAALAGAAPRSNRTEELDLTSAFEAAAAAMAKTGSAATSPGKVPTAGVTNVRASPNKQSTSKAPAVAAPQRPSAPGTVSTAADKLKVVISPKAAGLGFVSPAAKPPTVAKDSSAMPARAASAPDPKSPAVNQPSLAKSPALRQPSVKSSTAAKPPPARPPPVQSQVAKDSPASKVPMAEPPTSQKQPVVNSLAAPKLSAVQSATGVKPSKTNSPARDRSSSAKSAAVEKPVSAGAVTATQPLPRKPPTNAGSSSALPPAPAGDPNTSAPPGASTHAAKPSVTEKPACSHTDASPSASNPEASADQLEHQREEALRRAEEQCLALPKSGTSQTGFLGVAQQGKRYVALFLGKAVGTFDTAEEASLHYVLCKQEHRRQLREQRNLKLPLPSEALMAAAVPAERSHSHGKAKMHVGASDLRDVHPSKAAEFIFQARDTAAAEAAKAAESALVAAEAAAAANAVAHALQAPHLAAGYAQPYARRTPKPTSSQAASVESLDGAAAAEFVVRKRGRPQKDAAINSQVASSTLPTGLGSSEEQTEASSRKAQRAAASSASRKVLTAQQEKRRKQLLAAKEDVLAAVRELPASQADDEKRLHGWVVWLQQPPSEGLISSRLRASPAAPKICAKSPDGVVMSCIEDIEKQLERDVDIWTLAQADGYAKGCPADSVASSRARGIQLDASADDAAELRDGVKRSAPEASEPSKRRCAVSDLDPPCGPLPVAHPLDPSVAPIQTGGKLPRPIGPEGSKVVVAAACLGEETRQALAAIRVDWMEQQLAPGSHWADREALPTPIVLQAAEPRPPSGVRSAAVLDAFLQAGHSYTPLSGDTDIEMHAQLRTRTGVPPLLSEMSRLLLDVELTPFLPKAVMKERLLKMVTHQHPYGACRTVGLFHRRAAVGSDKVQPSTASRSSLLAAASIRLHQTMGGEVVLLEVLCCATATRRDVAGIRKSGMVLTELSRRTVAALILELALALTAQWRRTELAKAEEAERNAQRKQDLKLQKQQHEQPHRQSQKQPHLQGQPPHDHMQQEHADEQAPQAAVASASPTTAPEVPSGKDAEAEHEALVIIHAAPQEVPFWNHLGFVSPRDLQPGRWRNIALNAVVRDEPPLECYIPRGLSSGQEKGPITLAMVAKPSKCYIGTAIRAWQLVSEAFGANLLMASE